MVSPKKEGGLGGREGGGVVKGLSSLLIPTETTQKKRKGDLRSKMTQGGGPVGKSAWAGEEGA